MIHIFIINHSAGSKHLAKDLRSHLAQIEGLQYFVFNTIDAGFETDIVEKICKYFDGEQLRFYCCGGSGTMRNMLNGFSDLSNVEVAFFPCGLTNDFLKTFPDETPFKNIDNLIYGKVIPVDYIKTNYGVAINTISFGFDTDVEINMRTFRIYDIFSSMVPYILSLIGSLVFLKPKAVRLTIDGEEVSDKFIEIIFANGCVLGGNLYISERTRIDDGRATYVSVPCITGVKALKVLLQLMNKKLPELKDKIDVGECKKMEIKSTDGKPLYINFDGELVKCGDSCKIQIVRKGLKLVVPQEVELTEYVLQ